MMNRIIIILSMLLYSFIGVSQDVTFSLPDTSLYEYVGQLAVTEVSFPYPANEPIDTMEIIRLLSEVAEEQKEAQIFTFDFPECYIFPSCYPNTVGRPVATLTYTEPLITVRYSFCVYKEKTCNDIFIESNPPVILDTMMIDTSIIVTPIDTNIFNPVDTNIINPIDTTIPTMGEWGLFCLSILLAIFAVQSIKQTIKETVTL